MAETTVSDLKVRLEGIRDERSTHANTAYRIGSAMLELLSYAEAVAGSVDLSGLERAISLKVNLANLTELLTPLDSQKNPISWNEATLSNTAYLRANVDFFSTGGVSALGVGASGGGGGGADLGALLASLNSSGVGSSAPGADNVGKCLVWTANGWSWGTTGSGGTSDLTLAQVWGSLNGNTDQHANSKINVAHIPGVYMQAETGGKYTSARLPSDMSAEIKAATGDGWIEWWQGSQDGWMNHAMGHLILADSSAQIQTYGTDGLSFNLPSKSGTLALSSDIPTTMAWGNITGKPSNLVTTVAPKSATAGMVVTHGTVSGSTLTLQRGSLSSILNAAGYTWWGQTMSANGSVKGSITVGDGAADETHYVQIGGAMLKWDSDNNALFVERYDGEACNFYSRGGVSALGAGASGGGTSIGALLSSINESTIGATTPGATNVGKCLVWTANGWSWGTTGSGGGGTVTSITAGTGLSGGTITTNGSIGISSEYQTRISHGETAYNSLQNYLPLSGGTLTGALHMGSAAGVSPFIYWGDGTYAYIGEDADDHITLRGDKGVNILTGSTYELSWNGDKLATQKWVGEQGFVTSSGVTSVGLSAPTGFTVSGSPVTTSGTLNFGIASGYFMPTTAQRTTWNNKQDAISDLTTIRSNALHGESAYNNLSLYLLKTQGMRFVTQENYVAARFVTAAGAYDNERAAKAQGDGYIEWWSDGGYFNHEMGWIRAKGNVTIGESTTDTTHYLQIGGGRLYWDNTNKALYVQQADGTAAHFYATGGVSALGMGVSGTASLNTLKTGTLDVTGTATINTLAVTNTIESLDVDELAIVNQLMLNGNNIYMDGGNIQDAYNIQTSELKVGSGGSTIKKIYWNGTYLQVQIGSSTYNFRPV